MPGSDLVGAQGEGMEEVSPSSHDPGSEGSDSTQRPLWLARFLVTLEEATSQNIALRTCSASPDPEALGTFSPSPAYRSCHSDLGQEVGEGGGCCPKGETGERT